MGLLLKKEVEDEFIQFLEAEYAAEIMANILAGKYFIVFDFSKLSINLPSLADLVLDQPRKVIKEFRELIKERFLLNHKKKDWFEVRFKNLPGTQKVFINNLRMEDMDRLVCIEGVVKRTRSVIHRITDILFECPACGTNIWKKQSDNKIVHPMCGSCAFKKGHIVRDKKMIDYQRILLEETPDRVAEGNLKQLECYFQGQLCEPGFKGVSTAGNRIVVTGYFQEMPKYLRKGPTEIEPTTIPTIFRAVNIEVTQMEFTDITMTLEEIKMITELSEREDLKSLLIRSFASDIMGHDNIKYAILLQLVRGVKKFRQDGTFTRDFFHILLVGDPGTAKSRLLVAACGIAPKYRKTDGSGGTSKAGLTGSISKDEITGEWILDAGALVLANKGLLALDEMDKMNNEDRDGVHEPMEMGTVTKTKANINAQMCAETSVLAACNPKYGRFDYYQALIGQVDIPPAVFSRFDLIFAIKDEPEEEKDLALAEYILEGHMPGGMEKRRPPLEADFLRKYLAYAVKNIKPVLTEDAKNHLKQYYSKLRKRSTSVGGERKPVTVTPRQLEGLVRLAEASAKLRLSVEVTLDDAKEATGLVDFFMKELGTDPDTGEIDIDRITSGITQSQRNQYDAVKDIIKRLEESCVGEKLASEEDIVLEADKKNIGSAKVEQILMNLSRKGDIFEPRNGFWRTIS